MFLSPALLTNAAALFKREYDPENGGFGGAPKFPRPSQPAFLLRYALEAGDPVAVQMVLHTCDRMAAGGIHDQIGGGFSRYSVDAKWLVPHFEKMLYDNAQLANLYLDAFLVGRRGRSTPTTARDIIRYVLRDMTHPEGGFYSAEDADSEGKEGKFYCWTKEELSGLLTAGEFNVAARYFGVTHAGQLCGPQRSRSAAGPKCPERGRSAIVAGRTGHAGVGEGENPQRAQQAGPPAPWTTKCWRRGTA